MPKSLFALAAGAALALAIAPAAQAVTPRLTADPERKVLEKSGWTYVGVSDGVLIYMKDALTAGGPRKVVTAYESLTPKEREGFAFRSVESVSEFDCEHGRTRVIQETFYEEASLKGKTYTSPNFAETEWSNTVDGSVGMMRIAFACRERPLA